MKYIARNLVIALFSITGITYVYRAWTRRKGPLVRVVVFHDVTDEAWFDATIRALKDSYHIVTPSEYAERKFVDTKINVLITFDDGYASWVRVCLPILSAHNCKAIFFINSGLLDASSDETTRRTYVRDGLLLRDVHDTLTWESLGLLSAQGHMIGGHGKSHVRLSTVPSERQRLEIVDDKSRIESMTQSTLTSFAYPFGNRRDFTPDTETLARDAGYREIFSTEPGFAHPSIGSVARVCLPDALAPSSLARWVEGGYDLYAMLKRICVR